MRKYIQALKARREENGEAGFSLVELIVVVVILGILAAVAIPIFNGIQKKAEENALAAVVGNGASQVAAAIAINDATKTPDAALQALATQSKDEMPGITLALTGSKIDDFCVTGKTTAVTEEKKSGPGCS